MSTISSKLAKTGALAVLFAVSLSLGNALAASSPGGGGGGGGGSSGGGSSSNSGGGSGGNNGTAPIVCRTGFVFSEEEKICVRQQALNDADLFEQGNALALAGHYESALDVLGAIRDKDDAMVLTMIGYSTRKLGDTEAGIAIYHQALAIDPNNLNTHEYLGEGYIAAGRIDLAEVELDTLQRLCGVDCEQYRDLEKAFAGAPVWN